MTASKPYEEVQEVIQPQPTPVGWLVSVAVFPDPIKGTSQKFVVLDEYTTRGMTRSFLEAGAARIVAAQILEAADQVDHAGAALDIVRGGRANQIVHHMGRAPQHNGRVTN